MTDLTPVTADYLMTAAPVARCIDNSRDTLLVQFNAEPPQFAITRLQTNDRASQQDHLNSFLYALVTEAESTGITLNRSHFIFKDLNAGQAGGSAMASSPSPSISTKQKVTWAKAEMKRADTQLAAPATAKQQHTYLARQRAGEQSRSLEFNATELVTALERNLGTGCAVTYGAVDGRPAINITPTSLISQLLIDAGITVPEIDEAFAKAVTRAFKEVVKREPEAHEIVINDDRFADVTRIRIFGKERITDPARSNRRELGGGGMGMGSR